MNLYEVSIMQSLLYNKELEACVFI